MAFFIGKGDEANLRIGGFLTARVHVVIRGDGLTYVAQHIGGLRAFKVNGETTKRAELRQGDILAIGSHKFMFVLDSGSD